MGNIWLLFSKTISSSSATSEIFSDEYKCGNIFPSDACSHNKCSKLIVFTFNKSKLGAPLAPLMRPLVNKIASKD